jgi:hypothetical protein
MVVVAVVLMFMSKVVLITTIRRNSNPRVQVEMYLFLSPRMQIEMAYIITSIFSPNFHSESCLPCTYRMEGSSASS